MAWTLQFSDSFTGAGPTPLETYDSVHWVKQGAAAANVDSNLCQCRGDLGLVVYKLAVTLANDQAVEFKDVAAINTAAGLRCTDGASADAWTGYMVYIDGANHLRIYRNDAGAFTLLASSTGTLSANDIARCEAIGSNFTAYINGVATDATAADATYPSGHSLLRSDSFANNIDDFAVYDQAGAGGNTLSFGSVSSSWTKNIGLASEHFGFSYRNGVWARYAPKASVDVKPVSRATSWTKNAGLASNTLAGNSRSATWATHNATALFATVLAFGSRAMTWSVKAVSLATSPVLTIVSKLVSNLVSKVVRKLVSPT